MIDKNTNFFIIEDNYAKTSQIHSIPICEAKLDFITQVTIAIPTYKRPGLLKEAIDSAIAQEDYTDFDIIVVDNNPERECETEKLLSTYKNPILSYYKNSENIQMTGNLNRCFELARGAYVVLLHDDDLLLPTFIKDCMAILNKYHKIGILKPASYLWKSGSELIDFNIINRNRKYKLQRLYDFSNYNAFLLGPPTGCVFKKKDAIELGGFNPEFFPIMDFCFAVVFSQNRIVYNYSKTLSVYRLIENESFKLNTLLTSFEYTYYLTRQIIEKYRFPNYLVDKFLGCRVKYMIPGHIAYNSNFEFDIKKLDLRYPNKITIFLYKVTVKITNVFMRLFLCRTI